MNLYLLGWFMFLTTCAMSLAIQLQQTAGTVNKHGLELRKVLSTSDAHIAAHIAQTYADQTSLKRAAAELRKSKK